MVLSQLRAPASPLVSPDETVVLILEPVAKNLSALDGAIRKSLRARLTTLLKAASISGVPAVIVSHKSDRMNGLPGHAARESVIEIDGGDVLNPWDDAGLLATLQRMHRRNVILAGFWLEDTITATAIQAIDDGFDAYVVADAAAARQPRFSHLVHDRLTQCWVMPILTQQLLHEWSIAGLDPPRRKALARLHVDEISNPRP